MKYLTTILIFLISSISAFSQNLVPNPGFDTMQFNKKGRTYATGWHTNRYAYHLQVVGHMMNAHSKLGEIKIKLYPKNGYAYAKLTSPLKKDSIYKISLFERLDEFIFRCGYAVYGIPVYLSDTILSPKNKKGYSPVFLKNKLNVPLTNMFSWEKVETYYKASGREKYLTIGILAQKDHQIIDNIFALDFKISEEELKAERKIKHFTVADYFIDDIVLEPVKNSSVFDIDSALYSPIEKINEQNKILWNGYRLKWKDIIIKENNKKEYFEKTVNFTYTQSYIKKGILPIIDIKAYYTGDTLFVNNLRLINTTLLLRHEQLKFDITELFARKFRQFLWRYYFSSKKQVEKKLPKIYKKIHREWITYEKLYEKETLQGKNKEKQKEWEKRVAEELDKLKQFSFCKIRLSIVGYVGWSEGDVLPSGFY